MGNAESTLAGAGSHEAAGAAALPQETDLQATPAWLPALQPLSATQAYGPTDTIWTTSVLTAPTLAAALGKPAVPPTNKPLAAAAASIGAHGPADGRTGGGRIGEVDTLPPQPP